MTKKDYIKIAAILKDAPSGDGHAEHTRQTIARQLAAILRADNDRFQTERFLTAAGVKGGR